MITSKKELEQYIESDNAWSMPHNAKQKLVSEIAAYPTADLKRFLRYLRKQEYFINKAGSNKIKGIAGLYYERKKNKLGNKLGIEIHPNCFEKGLNIYHIGSIIVNHKARIGENCSLRGCNCIGNDGFVDKVPKIGNNVEIGFGAIIFGDIEIADNIKIGANAVVNKSFTEPGCTIAGVPARVVRKSDEKQTGVKNG